MSSVGGSPNDKNQNETEEVEYENVTRGPTTVHNSSYPKLSSTRESQNIENPRYNMDYALDYPYHYEEHETIKPSKFVAFKIPNENNRPNSVHNPSYSDQTLTRSSQTIENPRYNLDYGLDYPYNYVPEEQQEKRKPPEFVKYRRPPPPRPPLPTSDIPHSRNMTCIDNIIDFSFDYWRHMLVGVGVFFVLLVVLLILILVVWKPSGRGGTATTSTTTAPTKSTTTNPPYHCPGKFWLIDNKCWMFVAKEMPSDEAEGYCVAFGAHLVTLRDDIDNDSLWGFTKSDSPLWIGLECCGNEQMACRWNHKDYLDQGRDKYHFADGSPDWLNGTCVYFQNKQWVSAECRERQLPFVCETTTLESTLSSRVHRTSENMHPHYCKDLLKESS